jgi:cobalt-zinc-cadmium resistance protein CzcA
VAVSMFIKPKKENLNSLSHRLINKLNSWYLPVITWALGNVKKVLYGALGLLLLIVGLFTTMGGEFIPTLDEGDFVIQPVLKTGTSLSKTIEITTKIETIVLNNFPVVSQVVSRIGAAEVPTDPMSMEESDIIVKLKPKSEWVSAASKDELADKIKAKLEAKIPNVEIEFTQPIEMRFNELISGSRSDVAVKIYGEDLDILAKNKDFKGFTKETINFYKDDYHCLSGFYQKNKFIVVATTEEKDIFKINDVEYFADRRGIFNSKTGQELKC